MKNTVKHAMQIYKFNNLNVPVVISGLKILKSCFAW